MDREAFLYEMEGLLYSIRLDAKKITHYYKKQREEIYCGVDKLSKQYDEIVPAPEVRKLA